MQGNLLRFINNPSTLNKISEIASALLVDVRYYLNGNDDILFKRISSALLKKNYPKICVAN